MDTSTTPSAPVAVVDTFTSANPFLGETDTLTVAGRTLDGQRTLNGRHPLNGQRLLDEIPTQRSHG
jgi:hypothetical protein